MKKLLSLFGLAIVITTAIAQNQVETKPKLSPLTRKFILDQKAQLNSTNQQYVFKKTADGKTYISALIKVSDEANAQTGLKNIGAHIGTKAGKIWTVKVPVEKTEAFTQLKGIAYIQMDEPVKPHLNIVRTVTRADSLQKGINLPKKYSGKNVVVGIIDFGFDYNHPSLFDTTGTHYRVKKVWELNGVGTPPAGYTYGRELKDSNEIKAQTTDNEKQTHGACVAGVAAGSGFGSPLSGTKFRGLAYDADLVLVGVRRDSIEQQWMEGGFSDFLDGIKYIFDYAQSVHKPCVINISWGSQSGPHDGTTLFNEACENLVGSGRILVMSAGNEGQENIHLSKTFTTTDTLLNTFLDFTPATYKRTWVDVWGEQSKTFCASVTLYKDSVAGNTTGMICIDDQTHSFTLIGANGTDSCTVDIITSAAEFNGKPRTTISIFNHGADSIGITLKGTDGTIHAWDEYYYYGYTNGFQSAFSSHGYPWAENGNTITTVSDMGAGKSTILVGAYTSKTSWTDINRNSWSYPSSYTNAGEIAPFSSRGPMTDGRVKPDITAPGITMATAYSSYDADYLPTGSKSTSLVASYTNPQTQRKYYYGEFTGTSASAPVTSGIVALMLEANPSFFPSHLQKILAQTSITDAFTGTLPAAGNNTWGHGKINAYAALKMAVTLIGLPKYTGKKLECMVYPNPSKGNFTLDYMSNTQNNLKVEILNCNGSIILSQDWKTNSGSNSNSFDLSSAPQGLYIVRVLSDEGSAVMKLIVE
jgi:minor extracellular serine protease Vpr